MVFFLILLAHHADRIESFLAKFTTRMSTSKFTSTSMDDLKTIIEEDVSQILCRYCLIIDAIDRVDGLAEILQPITMSQLTCPKVLLLARTNSIASSAVLQITATLTDHDIKTYLQSQLGSSSRGQHQEIRGRNQAVLRNLLVV